MAETKNPLASKTIIGALVALVCFGVNMFYGVSVDPETQALVIDETMKIIASIGAVSGTGLAIYGRIKADKKIGV